MHKKLRKNAQIYLRYAEQHQQVQSYVEYSVSYINYLSNGKNEHWSCSKRQQVYYIPRKLLPTTNKYRQNLSTSDNIHKRKRHSVADMANR